MAPTTFIILKIIVAIIPGITKIDKPKKAIIAAIKVRNRYGKTLKRLLLNSLAITNSLST